MSNETIFILIVALATLMVLAETLREAFHDGPAAQGPPRSHREDERFAPPSRPASPPPRVGPATHPRRPPGLSGAARRRGCAKSVSSCQPTAALAPL